MSTIETILSRMMKDPAFADEVLAKTKNVLANYNLSVEELAQIRSMSRAEFISFAAEERKSFASTATVGGSHFFQIRNEGG